MLKAGDVIKTEIEVRIAGEYDVIVCGGGTAGCVAAIAAARSGVSTLLLEGGYFLGGMMSAGNAGLTKAIMHGKDADTQTKIVETLRNDPERVRLVGGIPLEMIHRLLENGAAVGTGGTAASYVYTDSHEFKIMLFDMMKEAGVHVMLHSPVCGVFREDGAITGVAVQVKNGRQGYAGRYFIDATGDGDLAAMAGVRFTLGVGPEDAVYKQGLSALGTLQNIGSMFRIGGVDFDGYVAHIKKHPEAFAVQRFGLQTYEEFIKAHERGEMMIGLGKAPSGRTFQIYNYPRKGIMIGCISVKGSRNGLDTEELTQAEYDVMTAAKSLVDEMHSLPGFKNAFVLDVPQAGVRETRHFEGEYKMNVADILLQREFEDTIGKGCHPIDIHPLPNEVKEIPQKDEWYFNIPYRCLVAKGVDNLLLAGRCISSTREAAGCTRPTIPCMVSGEAAGTAAAICVNENVGAARDIDVQILRKQLREQGARI
ncbi:MAG: FAD-dependent oxidoreductase [Eubacteriales bacterium]|nr:FAD-dependent oxidoreductase [Eubacteriales bacterium]